MNSLTTNQRMPQLRLPPVRGGKSPLPDYVERLQGKWEPINHRRAEEAVGDFNRAGRAT